jgi:putative CocE/NonD family hydrolase
LVAIAPAASPAAGADMPGIGMIGTAYIAQWLAFTSGKTLQLQEYLDSARWGALLRAWTEEGTPFRTLDARIGFPSPLFQTWADHPDQDAYWSDYNPSEKDLRTLRAPSLTITGMYDEAQRGAMALYRARSAADPTAENWLVIGPWDHGGTRDPQTNVGGVDFGEAGRIDLNQLHLDYYGHAALGAPTPAFLRDRVAYYVTGAEKWRYAKTLDSVTAAQRPAYLGPNGSLTYALGSGSDRYVWDPRDTSAAKAEAEGDPSLLIDQPTPKPALVYETQPFEADTELSGFLKLTAWISIDQPDTDFDLSVRLLRTDGSTVRLSNALSRARYREGWARPQLIRTHEPLRYEISNFPFISRLVRKGERLQLVVGPSTSIWVEKNYNTGGRVADGTLSESRAVAVTLVHDAKHPSALYLPIAASDADSNSAAARMPQKPGP